MEVLGHTIGRVGAALALTALVGCAHHGGGKHKYGNSQGGISVSGSGEAHGAPDIARTTAGVEVRAATPEEATGQAAAQMATLIDALKGVGIAPQDLRTQGYSVSYERDYQPAPAPAPVRATGARVQVIAAAPVVPPGRYLVTNSVEITVRKVNELGKVLSTATNAGANNVWGISFDIEDREPLVGKARELAFAQAQTRAEQIAALAGLKLGPIVSISDGNEGGGGGVTPMFARMAADSAVPVERGELAVSHEVHVQYAIAGAAGPHAGGHHPHHGAHPAPPPPPPPAAPAPVPPAPAPVPAPAPQAAPTPVVVAPAPAVPPPAPAGATAPVPAARVAPTAAASTPLIVPAAPAKPAAPPAAATPATPAPAVQATVAAPAVR